VCCCSPTVSLLCRVECESESCPSPSVLLSPRSRSSLRLAARGEFVKIRKRLKTRDQPFPPFSSLGRSLSRRNSPFTTWEASWDEQEASRAALDCSRQKKAKEKETTASSSRLFLNKLPSPSSPYSSSSLSTTNLLLGAAPPASFSSLDSRSFLPLPERSFFLREEDEF
jgi:hypothetical protein